MISVVIPALNEADAIESTVQSLRSVLSKMEIGDFEIVIVDDGSVDSTYEKAMRTGATVVRHPHNIGYGRSLKDGIKAARHDCIAIVDADLTYPIEEIPTLYAAYQQGFDMVVGARTGIHYSESILKAPLRTLLQWLVEFTAGRTVPDVNSGLRIFSKTAVSEHFDHLCDTFSFTTSMTLAYMMTGRFVKYIPITYNARLGHSKVKLIRDSLRTLQYITQAMVYYNPLKIFVLLSLCCLVVSGIAPVAGAFSQVSLLVSMAAALQAILMFGMGLMGSLLRQLNVGTSRTAKVAQVLDFSVSRAEITSSFPVALVSSGESAAIESRS